MSRALNKHIGPVPFLVHDPCELSVIVKPRSRGGTREALNATKRRVLSRDL